MIIPVYAKTTVIRVAFALVIAAVLGLSVSPEANKTAAIVDQLSLSVPNPNFVAAATSLLEQSGYVVDYYPGEEVTLDFYRELPRLRYDFIIFRVHSVQGITVGATTGEQYGGKFVALLTGEPFSEYKHLEELREGLVSRGVTADASPPRFGIGNRFVEERMKGRFKNTMIVFMGCNGLSTQRTAQAFLDKGAKAFVGWSELVSASHTDASTQRLLEKLLLEGLSVWDAVAQTATEVGPDPWFGAELRVLPSQG